MTCKHYKYLCADVTEDEHDGIVPDRGFSSVQKCSRISVWCSSLTLHHLAFSVGHLPYGRREESYSPLFPCGHSHTSSFFLHQLIIRIVCGCTGGLRTGKRAKVVGNLLHVYSYAVHLCTCATNRSQVLSNESRLPKKGRPRCYTKSPIVQDAIWPIPGIIRCAAVTRRWGLLFCAENKCSLWAVAIQPSLSIKQTEASRRHYAYNKTNRTVNVYNRVRTL